MSRKGRSTMAASAMGRSRARLFFRGASHVWVSRLDSLAPLFEGAEGHYPASLGPYLRRTHPGTREAITKKTAATARYPRVFGRLPRPLTSAPPAKQ